MLRESVSGLIPLIGVQTDDLIHIEFVLENLFPDYELLKLKTSPETKDDALYYKILDADTIPDNLNDLYRDAEENEYSVIFVNAPQSPQIMNCGELLPDIDTVRAMLASALPEKIVDGATEHLHGLTVQNIKRVIPLSTVYFDRLSIETIRKTKELLFINIVGLQKIDPETPFYYEDEADAYVWVKLAKPYMFAEVDLRLVPKGVLLYGQPGTGKTEFAKYVARQWDLPLFLLDINAMLSKWQGEAEAHLTKALSVLDQESPCIVLFDEVEKLFLSDSENDTSQRLLSKLLWWLQSKQSRVFVAMTSNDITAIPPEMYRAGRISMNLEMRGLPVGLVKPFIDDLLDSFNADDVSVPKVIKHVDSLMKQSKATDKNFIPQALLSQWVIDFLQDQQFGI